MIKQILVVSTIVAIASTVFSSKPVTEMLQEKTKEVKDLKQKLAKAVQAEDQCKATLTVYQHYAKCIDLRKRPWFTPELVYSMILWGQKYRCLAPKYNYDVIDPEWFYLLWIANESSFDPRPSCVYTNKTGGAKGSKDYYIMQMNQCHLFEPDPRKNYWRRVDRLFPELAGREDSDTEKNVAVWYLWLNDQGEKRHTGVWDIYQKWSRTRKDVIELHDSLEAIR